MRYDELKTEYFEYLMGRVELDVKDNQPLGYVALCRILHDYSFIPIIPFDENRCGDCSDLRHEFSDEYGDMLDSILPATGTMLELMVVLVGILDYNTIGSKYERSKDRWFLELLDNIGLIKFNNHLIAMLPDEFVKLNVIGVLENLNYRLFDRDGGGSFFPLRYPASDQRHVEILIQLNDYIAENYDIS